MTELLIFGTLGIYFMCAVLLGCFGLNCYVMIGLFCAGRRRAKERDRELLRRFHAHFDSCSWPVVTTQLPIFNEKFVSERLLNAVAAFDYPRDKHEIQVLDDSVDETSEIIAARVAELRSQGLWIEHVRRNNREGYKAGALAEGMRIAHGEFLAIFDADFLPEPDYLQKTVPFLLEDPECAFVQARWGHCNRDFSLLTMAQSIGIDGHFVVEQSARGWSGLLLNFNGTAGVWRRQAIEDAGGWSSDTITEDLDLSYRTQLAGWKGRYLLDVVTPAELPTNINAFKSQQQRWARGSIQTARKILPRLLRRKDFPWFTKLQAVMHLTHYMVHPTILAMTLLVLPLLLWGQRSFTPYVMWPLFSIMIVSMMAPSALYVFSQKVTDREWWIRLIYLPVLIVLGMGLAVNNTKGVLAALFKREHGVFVRTPKLGALALRQDQASAANSRMASALRTASVYCIPLSPLCWFELLMGLWAVAAFSAYLFRYNFLVGPILLLHAVGFLCVGFLSIAHELKLFPSKIAMESLAQKTSGETRIHADDTSPSLVSGLPTARRP